MSSLREALEQGYDDLEAAGTSDADPVDDGASAVPDTAAEPTESPASPAAEPQTSTEATAAERARDESGKFTKAAEAPKAGKTVAAKAAASAVPGKTTAAVASPPPAAVAPVPAVQAKAPQALKPVARELWSKLGPEFEPLKQDFARRERETALAIQQAAESAKSNQPFKELLAPYESAIRAQGVEPRQYVENVLQSAHVIFNGPPQNRAAALADIIMNAGVPPDLLDQALVARIQGRGMAPQAQQPQQAQYRDPRVDQLFQTLEQAKTQRVQQAQAEAEATAATFTEKHEFAADVAGDVANILEVWARQGKTSVTNEDLDRAYNLACQMNPDVAPLLEQRKAAEAAQKAIASTARAKTAASSVRNQPSAAPAAQAAGRRQVLEAKYDELDNG